MPTTTTAAAKDVLSQIRDLQLAIEDFGIQESLPIADDNDTTSYKRNSKILYPSDEKTIVDEGQEPEMILPTTAVVERPTATEKTLVERITGPATTTVAYEPLDKVSIRFSNDFSSLLDHFKTLQDQCSDKSNIHYQQTRTGQPPPRLKVDTTATMTTMRKVDTPASTKQLDESEPPHSYSDQPSTPFLALQPPAPAPPLPLVHSPFSDLPWSPCVATPRTRSSISSRRSRRPSTLCKKSRYFNKPANKKEPVYTARSYDEMMRIPNPSERIAFYEKTFKQCVRASSQLTSWMDRVKAKGVPKPMTEGYQPPPRPLMDEATDSTISFYSSSTTTTTTTTTTNNNSSFSSSISVFLKKASATSSLGRRTPFRNITFTPRMPMSRFFLPPSTSRLSFSRPTARPKVIPFSSADDISLHSQKSKDAHKTPRPMGSFEPAKTTATRWRSPSIKALPPTAVQTPSFARKRSTAASRTNNMSPRSVTLEFSKLSRPPKPPGHPDPYATNMRQQKTMPPGVDGALSEMCNNLPNIDRGVLEKYLREAGGDQIVAITLAMSQLKKTPVHAVYR